MQQQVIVQGLKSNYKEPLTSFIPDSFYIEWQQNNNWQMQFTAFDDNSIAYDELDVQGNVFFNGQQYVIKQCLPTFSKGIATKQITAVHVMYECVDVWQYNENQNVQTYSVQDVINYYFNGNNLGYQVDVQGNFPTAQIQDLGNGSGKDCLSKICSTWPNAIVFADNKHITVYDQQHFQKDNGNIIGYLNNASDINITADSTSLTNYTKCVSGTHNVQTTTTTSSTTSVSNGGAAAVQADARKYLGVPYVYGGAGGARGGNPMTGMDCSSFVSQVYLDFGIHIPAYTVSMESCGYQIPLSEVTTGDMLFYGPHGATHHVALALDNTNMIFEPEPGESCKEEPISDYPPTWALRNPQMYAIVTGKHNETTTTTSESDKDVKWFNDFYVQNDESVKKYGIHPMAAISDDRFHDANSMRQYALSQMQPEPTLTIQVTLLTNEQPIAGDLSHVIIPQSDLKTTVAVVGYQYYPFSSNNQTTITLNSTQKTIFDYHQNYQNNIQRAISGLQNENSSLLDNSIQTINAGESVVSYD